MNDANKRTAVIAAAIIFGAVALLAAVSDDSDATVTSNTSTSSSYVEEESNDDESYWVGLAQEGQALAEEISALSDDGVTAASAGDLEGACGIADQIHAKVGRLVEITDEIEGAPISEDLIDGVRSPVATLVEADETMQSLC